MTTEPKTRRQIDRLAQLDLFDARVADERFGLSVSPVVLREEERFGKWDARTGLSLRNYYSHRISGARLAAYERAFREERETKWKMEGPSVSQGAL